MGRAERIRKLLDALEPTRLELVDDSAKHQGHSGWREGGETHYQLTIASQAFDGKSKVQRQRLVYRALSEEFSSGLHALSITALTPEEGDA